MGVLNVSETKDGVQFRDADIEMLSIIVDQAMMAVENIRSIREKQESSRIRSQLEQYVSPEVSHMLVEKHHNLTEVGRGKLRLSWEWKEGIFKNVGLGIGISRGPMFLGNVGSSTRLDYTVIGQDVNIAQRLAAITDSGQILITDQVNATLNSSFPVKAQKKMLLRGMESEVVVYSLSALMDS